MGIFEQYLVRAAAGSSPNKVCKKTTSVSTALRFFVLPSFIGNWGVFTAFQILEPFQSLDALKGQEALKCAPNLPG